ncbi:ABC transporter ATP-binding protein [Halomontanus rarus]|uniref:ABC transporter ATP-binding protein n=1 Tax=Halomontanus rarus TaxID=3034020 RepID=UPI0023E7CC57|nr:ABC transporter ATP-binding protein [Halovivax sp. TS33]
MAVDDLRTYIPADGGVIRAVDGVSFEVDRGETVCLVGESGSGKTVTCDSILGLEPAASGDVSGEVRFEGRNLLSVGGAELRTIRGNRIAYVFQHSQAALDPVYTVGDQIAEAIAFHGDVTDDAARERAISLLRRVGLSRAGERVDQYPHELSDGMCQRVAIAVALAAEPDLLIADEPASALDVTIQARIIDLLETLARERDLAMLLVTHDLRVVSSLADRVVVLYNGVVMERGPVDRVFAQPAHPYTQALFRSFTDDLRGGEEVEAGAGSRSMSRTGVQPPDDGCPFRLECPHAIPVCRDRLPLETVADLDTHRAACVYYGVGRDASTVLSEATAVGVERDRDQEQERERERKLDREGNRDRDEDRDRNSNSNPDPNREWNRGDDGD